MQAPPQGAQAPGERRAFQTNLITVVIISLFTLLAFTANPGHFEPVLLFFGLIVAAIFYYGRAFFDRLDHLIRILAQTKGASPQPPAGLCPSCGGEVSTGAKFCPRCGARLG